MRAQVFTAAGQPLVAAELPAPRPAPQQVVLAVRACAVCRTDLHVVDGELPDPKLPLVLGHEIIGTVVEKGESVDRFAIGDRVGGSSPSPAPATGRRRISRDRSGRNGLGIQPQRRPNHSMRR